VSRWKIFVIAAWLGSGAFLMLVAAPSAFRNAPDSGIAGNIVGSMLDRWHYVAIFAPAILLIAEWRKERLQRTAPVLLLVAALLFASLQVLADVRVHRIRDASLVPIGMLSKSDPVRKRFGMMHGISSALMLAQVLMAAGVIVVSRPKTDSV
jgi:hypothetical protein